MLGVLMEVDVSGASTAVTETITGLGKSITPLIGAALGVAAIPFGAKWLWSKGKSLMGH